MPTIPPFTEPTHPDAWHQVTAPGGYEWWRFDAEDAQQDRRIAVRFIHGFVDHSKYAREYSLYRLSPTRFAPPAPREFVGVQLALYESGRARFVASVRFPSDQFTAATDWPTVGIGPNRIEPLADQNLRLTLQLNKAAAELVFRPQFSHPVYSKTIGATHRWLISAPLCHVEGTIQFEGSTIAFAGRGYHDHHFGTTPLSHFARNFFCGRVLSEDSSCAFLMIDDAAHLVQADSESIRGEEAEIHLGGEPGMTGSLIRYPTEIEIGQFVRLSNPRVMNASLLRASAIYDAAVPQDNSGKAWCEIFRPRRAGWLGEGWTKVS